MPNFRGSYNPEAFEIFSTSSGIDLNLTKLTHLNDSGEIAMVDVGDKPRSERLAKARGQVTVTLETLTAIKEGNLKKGDVIAVARVAGIMAAKQTSSLIPLCHPLETTKIDVHIYLNEDPPHVGIEATVKSVGKTGVEMEALTAVSVAALTVYDMAKSLQRDMRIEGIEVVEKRGGKSGTYTREQ